MKHTYQPNRRKKQKKHGFFPRAKTQAGKKILKARRHKGRKRLTI